MLTPTTSVGACPTSDLMADLFMICASGLVLGWRLR
jgi:hypothetical protein